ncbi:MAG: hypothetical protein RL492_1931, partial [Verrucomicrobiota bacterium]
MRVFLALLTFLAAWSAPVRAAEPSDGALRVLYFDARGAEQSAKGTLHDYMAALGRDAIWFDYASGPTPSSETLGFYDALLVKEDVPGLGNEVKLPDGKMIVVLRLKTDANADAFRKELLGKLNPARVSAWEKFLAQREPEVREENPNVANYERRPKPLTLQKPFSVKGSMERTQVPADMKLVLFAAEPDI